MPKRPVVPIRQLQHRLPVAGQIRAGDRGGTRGAPRALERWRFTSSDVDALDALAGRYGGTVRPWAEKKSAHTHELLTDAPEIEVALPPDCLRVSYELWAGSGRERRCDGEICHLPREQQGPDGLEVVEVEAPCLCVAKGWRECRPNIRLEVLIPFIRLSGTWVLYSKSENALAELPAAVQMIQLGDAIGLPYATLRLEPRKAAGKSFTVPVLGSAHSPEQLAAGAGRLGSRKVDDAAIDQAIEAVERGALPERVTVDEVEVVDTAPAGRQSDQAEPAGEGPGVVSHLAPAGSHLCAECGASLDGYAVTKQAGHYIHAKPSECAPAQTPQEPL